MSDVLPVIHLVRHGDTALTSTGQHTGRTDLALTDQGERDAQALGARLKGLRFDQVLTCPLQQARRTAELADFGECAQVEADLTEWDYGAYEGRRTVEIQAERPNWHLFEDGCPDGETMAALRVRADCTACTCVRIQHSTLKCNVPLIMMSSADVYPFV